jgi:Tol biopolymer transport system component
MRWYVLTLAAALSVAWMAVITITTAMGRAQPPVTALTFSMDYETKNEIMIFDLSRSLSFPITQHREDTFYGSVRWSPDGRKMAYVESYGARLRLHVKDFDCRACSFTLSENMYNYSTPIWLPGGDLLFVSDREGQSDIYRYNAETGEQQNLTQHQSYDAHPAVSLDGEQLAFVSLRGGDRDIYVMDLNCEVDCVPRNLTQHFSDDIAPVWSPDGQWIAFLSDRTWNYDLFVIDTNGTNVRNLTRSHGEETFPAWSPDSRLIAFVSDRPGNYEIYTADIATGRITNMTNHPATDFNHVWSPDGQHLLFLSNREDHQNRNNLYQVQTDGSNLRQIANNIPIGRLSEWRSYTD